MGHMPHDVEARDFRLEPLGLRAAKIRQVGNHTVAIFTLAAGRDAELVSALGAMDVLVLPLQRRRHRAGRDDERLRLERAKQKGEDERHDDRFDRLAKDEELPAVGRRLVGRALRGPRIAPQLRCFAFCHQLYIETESALN